MIEDQPTAALIARGRELTATIAASKRELEAIEAILRSRALAMPHEPLADKHREGRRATLKDADQQVAVVFESDILKASFAADSPTAKELLPLLDAKQTRQLFKSKTTYERANKDGQKFRLHCADVLGTELSATVIDLLKDRDRNGIVKSKTVIEWKQP
jgi:hypothetical protein